MYRYVRPFFNGKYNIFTGNGWVDVYSGSVEDLKSQKNQIFYSVKQRC